ncbi:MAG: hypothetical protein ACFFER_16240 [Candidatus Thorarchaeota archaeon]
MDRERIPKELIPRQITEEEMPRKTRATNLKEARSIVMKDYEEFIKSILEWEKKLHAIREETEQKISNILKEAAKQAMNEGRPFTWTERVDIENQYFYEDAYSAAYYPLLNAALLGLGPCEPDIDQADPYIKPGEGILLYGTCFGPPQGKVLLEISEGEIVELEAVEWSETRIYAVLNSLIGEAGLRPYYGRVWVQTGSGATSNVWPIMFEPILSVYAAIAGAAITGGWFGGSEDGVLLRNQRIADVDFEIESVKRIHEGDGWSKLKSPNAGGKDLQQGWHIGVKAFGLAQMLLEYRLIGPKNVPTPFFEDLGPWGYLGDIW